MYKIFFIIIFLNINWAIGLKALMIPQKANIIALSNTGIAGNIDPSINPASLAFINPYLSMSGNTWYANLSGSKSTCLWKSQNTSRYISIESLGIDDIEYHIDNTVEPIGYVEAQWIAFDFGSNIDLNKLFNNSRDYFIGYNIKLNYSKLHTTRYWGYTFDLGLYKEINDKYSVGIVMKNFGKEYLGNQTININNSFGLGTSYTTSLLNKNNFFMNLQVLFDYINYENNDTYKLAFKAGFPYVNLMVGSSYSSKKYQDFSYGISIQYKTWMIIFGSLVHENPALGTPTSFEVRKFF